MQNSNNAREYQEGTLDEAKHSWHSNFQFAIANENIARADHFPEGRCIPVFLPSAHNPLPVFSPYKYAISDSKYTISDSK